MYSNLVGIGLGLAAAIIAAQPVSLFEATAARAQTGGCAQRASVEQQLQDTFGEVEFGSGVSQTHAFKFFHNPKSKTWTIVAIQPNGIACIIAAGEALEFAHPKQMDSSF